MFRIFTLLIALAHVAAGEWAVVQSTPLAAPAKVAFRKIEVANGERRVVVHAVIFSAKDCAFALMDDPEGAYNLETASRRRGAFAAVNGGYFHPDRTPLGLRVRQGKEIHRLEKARLLSGLLTVSDGRPALVRVGEFKRSSSLREAVQAGPFLVDRGQAINGLNSSRSDERTAIIAGPRQQFGLVTIDRTTLAEAAAILATSSLFGDWNVVRALNLDGGSSTGLWVGGEKPFYQREWRDVRDFVAIVPK